MAFTATVFIQGVGVYVPHTDGKQLLVLFPNQEEAHKRGLRNSNKEKWCKHQTVVQVRQGNLVANGGDRWWTMFVQGSWLGFETDPPSSLSLPNPWTTLSNIPVLDGFLKEAGVVDSKPVAPDVLSLQDTSRLTSGVLIKSGTVRADLKHANSWTYKHNGSNVTTQLSNVLQVSIPALSSFKLLQRKFGVPTITQVPLQPMGTRLDVWIRHYCEIEVPPDVEPEPAKAGEPDADFTLNYALADKLSDWASPGAVLPVPTVYQTWAGGPGIGDRAHKCMGSQTAAAQTYDASKVGF